jgi:hypothetical protein
MWAFLPRIIAIAASSASIRYVDGFIHNNTNNQPPHAAGHQSASPLDSFN